MNYEEKYKEALERAKSFQEKYGGDYAGYIFPELAESEDERIRKELVAFFIEVRNREGNEGYWHDLKVANILAYLEKQKEQKPDEIPPYCTGVKGDPEPAGTRDMEEAANEYAGVNYDCETETDAFYHHVQKEAFIAGAEWQKKQDAARRK